MPPLDKAEPRHLACASISWGNCADDIISDGVGGRRWGFGRHKSHQRRKQDQGGGTVRSDGHGQFGLRAVRLSQSGSRPLRTVVVFIDDRHAAHGQQLFHRARLLRYRDGLLRG